MRKLLSLIILAILFQFSGLLNLKPLNNIGIKKLDFTGFEEKRIVLSEKLLLKPEQVGGQDNYEKIHRFLNVHSTANKIVLNFINDLS